MMLNGEDFLVCQYTEFSTGENRILHLAESFKYIRQVTEKKVEYFLNNIEI
jgi:hypothetical protein